MKSMRPVNAKNIVHSFSEIVFCVFGERHACNDVDFFDSFFLNLIQLINSFQLSNSRNADLTLRHSIACSSNRSFDFDVLGYSAPVCGLFACNAVPRKLRARAHHPESNPFKIDVKTLTRIRDGCTSIQYSRLLFTHVTCSRSEKRLSVCRLIRFADSEYARNPCFDHPAIRLESSDLWLSWHPGAVRTSPSPEQKSNLADCTQLMVRLKPLGQPFDARRVQTDKPIRRQN